jgi:hypothetical protein
MADHVYESVADLRAGFQDLMQELGAAAERGCEVTITPLDLISWAQRKLLNATLGDIAKQVRLTESGDYVHITAAPFGRELSVDSWRGVFMAITLGQSSVPNPDGDGYVVLSRSSKRLSKARFADCLELILAFGSHRGVVWTNPRYVEEAQLAALTEKRMAPELRSQR